MAIKWEDDEYYDPNGIHAVVKKLIETNEGLGFLAEAKIKCLFCIGPWTSKHTETWANIEKCSAKNHHLHEYDYILAVNKSIWDGLLDRKQREALVYHELSHCCRSNGGWSLQDHDFTGFNGEWRRYGAWRAEVELALKAYEEGKDERIEQLTLAIDEATEANQSGDPVQRVHAKIKLHAALDNSDPEIHDLFYAALDQRTRVVTADVNDPEILDDPGPAPDVDPAKLETAVHAIREHMGDEPATVGHPDPEPTNGATGNGPDLATLGPALAGNVRPIRPGVRTVPDGQAAGQVVF